MCFQAVVVEQSRCKIATEEGKPPAVTTATPLHGLRQDLHIASACDAERADSVHHPIMYIRPSRVIDEMLAVISNRILGRML